MKCHQLIHELDFVVDACGLLGLFHTRTEPDARIHMRRPARRDPVANTHNSVPLISRDRRCCGKSVMMHGGYTPRLAWQKVSGVVRELRPARRRQILRIRGGRRILRLADELEEDLKNCGSVDYDQQFFLSARTAAAGVGRGRTG
jgi:hypothetical protein